MLFLIVFLVLWQPSIAFIFFTNSNQSFNDDLGQVSESFLNKIKNLLTTKAFYIIFNYDID
ncbi:hypothetical protein GvMRE_IIg576 [endosymbiont GvMRE of Glomus versiforme]|nr:hypothetical protein GvMRE_IIg576 [endosymbiont GvMRE of Glomus versiforme]